jgi:hypothetical protein
MKPIEPCHVVGMVEFTLALLLSALIIKIKKTPHKCNLNCSMKICSKRQSTW